MQLSTDICDLTDLSRVTEREIGEVETTEAVCVAVPTIGL